MFNVILQKLAQQVMSGQMQNNPMMATFNQMMSGKSKEQQIQTLLNLAKSRGIDISDKCFTEEDIKSLGLK